MKLVELKEIIKEQIRERLLFESVSMTPGTWVISTKPFRGTFYSPKSGPLPGGQVYKIVGFHLPDQNLDQTYGVPNPIYPADRGPAGTKINAMNYARIRLLFHNKKTGKKFTLFVSPHELRNYFQAVPGEEPDPNDPNDSRTPDYRAVPPMPGEAVPMGEPM